MNKASNSLNGTTVINTICILKGARFIRVHDVKECYEARKLINLVKKIVNVSIDFNLLDFLDIILVSILLFQLYKLIKGTVAINIFIGIVSIYIYVENIFFRNGLSKRNI